jgi:hypothetical protein
MVCHPKGKLQSEDFWEQGVEENVQIEEVGSNRRLRKTA